MDEKEITKDDLIMEVIANSPGLSKRAIGRKCKELGLIGHENVIFQRLRKSELLAENIDNIDRYHKEVNARESMPLAQKRVNRALKNNSLNDKEVFPYVKLVYDKQFGEDRTPSNVQPFLHIDEVKLLVNQGLDNGSNNK